MIKVSPSQNFKSDCWRREAYCTVGYSPFLTFSVTQLQMTLTQLLQLGGTMDGSVKHLPKGKVGMC